MNIHIVLKTRLWSVLKNASIAEYIKASPNSTRDLRAVSSLTFGFLKEKIKKVMVSLGTNQINKLKKLKKSEVSYFSYEGVGPTL